MCPSFNSFGSNPSVSQLVWDTDLVIPAGKAIESASGEVGIVGDVSISGNLSTVEGISSGGNVTAAENLVGVNAVLSDKQLVIGESVGNASVTLTQIPSPVGNYTSPDFPISGLIEQVQYLVPPITFNAYDNDYYVSATFRIQAKIGDTYQTIAECTVPNVESGGTVSTETGLAPAGTTALRYTTSARFTLSTQKITSPLSLTLTPMPVY